MEMFIFFAVCIAAFFAWWTSCRTLTDTDNSSKPSTTYPSYSVIAQQNEQKTHGFSIESGTSSPGRASQFNNSFFKKWEYKPTVEEMINLNSREVGILINDVRGIQCKLIDFNEKHRRIAEKFVKCIVNIEKLTKEQIVASGSLLHAYWLAVKASDFDFISKANAYMISTLEACENNNERFELFMFFAQRPVPDMLYF